MKKPYSISLYSEPNAALEEFLQTFQAACKEIGLITKTVHFPSDGPLGQQIKITTTNRFSYDPITSKALTLIDKMDFYFHLNLAESQTKNTAFDILLLIHEDYIAVNPNQQLSDWEKEINSILPPSNLELCPDPANATITHSSKPPNTGYINMKSKSPFSISDCHLLLESIKKDTLSND